MNALTKSSGADFSSLLRIPKSLLRIARSYTKARIKLDGIFEQLYKKQGDIYRNMSKEEVRIAEEWKLIRQHAKMIKMSSLNNEYKIKGTIITKEYSQDTKLVVIKIRSVKKIKDDAFDGNKLLAKLLGYDDAGKSGGSYCEDSISNTLS